MKLGGTADFTESCRNQFANFENEEIGFGRGKRFMWRVRSAEGASHCNLRRESNQGRGQGAQPPN